MWRELWHLGLCAEIYARGGKDGNREVCGDSTSNANENGVAWLWDCSVSTGRSKYKIHRVFSFLNLKKSARARFTLPRHFFFSCIVGGTWFATPTCREFWHLGLNAEIFPFAGKNGNREVCGDLTSNANKNVVENDCEIGALVLDDQNTKDKEFSRS